MEVFRDPWISRERLESLRSHSPIALSEVLRRSNDSLPESHPDPKRLQTAKAARDMFDIGIGEMMILAVTALLVFGPDRLPGAANDAARMIRQARGALRGTATLLEESTGITAAEVRDQLERLNRMRPQSIARDLWSDDETDHPRVSGAPEPPLPPGPSGA